MARVCTPNPWSILHFQYLLITGVVTNDLSQGQPLRLAHLSLRRKACFIVCLLADLSSSDFGMALSKSLSTVNVEEKQIITMLLWYTPCHVLSLTATYCATSPWTAVSGDEGSGVTRLPVALAQFLIAPTGRTCLCWQGCLPVNPDLCSLNHF